jgi:hypothetical protein
LVLVLRFVLLYVISYGIFWGRIFYRTGSTKLEEGRGDGRDERDERNERDERDEGTRGMRGEDRTGDERKGKEGPEDEGKRGNGEGGREFQSHLGRGTVSQSLLHRVPFFMEHVIISRSWSSISEASYLAKARSTKAFRAGGNSAELLERV